MFARSIRDGASPTPCPPRRYSDCPVSSSADEQVVALDAIVSTAISARRRDRRARARPAVGAAAAPRTHERPDKFCADRARECRPHALDREEVDTMAGFTHLHLHTQYCLLDGAIRLKDLFKKTVEMGMDVGRRHRPRQHVRRDRLLQRRPRPPAIKPIFGCETYVAATDRTDRTEPPQLPPDPAREERGRVQEPPVPQLDGLPRGLLLPPAHRQELLKEHTEGLIGLSACLGGEIAQTLSNEGYDAGQGGRRRSTRALFEPGDFYPRDPAERPRRAGDGQRRLAQMASETRHPARRHRRLPLRQARATRTRTTS